MERGADAQAAFDVDRRKSLSQEAFQFWVGMTGITPFDPAARQQGVDIGLAAGEPHGRNIGFQQTAFGFETLERKIASSAVRISACSSSETAIWRTV